MAIIAPYHMQDQRSSCEYLREIAHVDPTAARFASEKMLGLVDRLHADALADDGAARDSISRQRILFNQTENFGSKSKRRRATLRLRRQ
jgi:hypothetical protein